MTTVDQHVVEAYLGDITPDTQLEVISGTLTLDENRAPFGEATLVTPIPADRSILDVVSDRTILHINARRIFGVEWALSEITTTLGGRISDVTAAMTTGALSEITALFWQGFNGQEPTSMQEIRTRMVALSTIVDELERTVTWEAATFEAILQGDVLIAADPLEPSRPKPTSALNTILTRNGLQLSGDLWPGTEPDLIEEAELWQPGASAWDYIESIMEWADRRLICLENGYFTVTLRPYNRTGTIVLGYGINATQIRDRREVRSSTWYDAVMLTYSYVNSLGVRIERTSFAGAQPSRNALVLRKESVRFPGTAAAANMLARTELRDRMFDIDAVSNYLTRPGKQTTITDGELDAVSGRISAVSFSWPENTMTVTTRFATT